MKKWIIVGIILLLSISVASATLYDDFTGNNGDPVDSSKWSASWGGSGSTSTVNIQSNECRMKSDTDSTRLESTNTFPDSIQFDFRWSSWNNKGHPDKDRTYFSVGSGHSHSTAIHDTGYYIYAYYDTENGYNYIKLYKRIDGSNTLLDSGDFPFTVDTEYTINWIITSSSIIVKSNGTTILESSDTIADFSGGYFEVYNNAIYQMVDTNYIDNVYDYDSSSGDHVTINLYDNCANLLVNATTVVYDADDDMNVLYAGNSNPITIPSYQVNENDELRVIWSTWHGLVSKTCYAQFDHDINLYDPFVYWIMDVYVYDNESNPIEDANVDFNQDCVINGYPARNEYTDYDGLAEFTQCENKGANLVVNKDGYQTLSTSISGGWYDAYTNTYEISVVLQQSNTSTWDIINNSINDTNATEEPQDIPDINDSPINVNLYFKDCNGQYTTQINDSDPYVRCYYDVIAMKPVSMTLVFQKSMSGYWFSDVYTYPYTIDNNSYGYMNLSNDNFSDPDYIYRAYIHDPSYPEYDRYVYLSVVNQTSEQETHYENLTALCMFVNTNNNGSIDYREEIKGYAYVVSDNASLRTVSLELYDNSTFIDYVNLTNSSFDDDLYEWELGYTYSLNHNYSLVLKASDGSILDCDNVIAYNIAGNKLTIKVIDAFNHNLDHVYVYVEHYGSINTGYLNYGTFEGLPNGETRYKATKFGYRSGVWKSVNLTDENEVVTYQLIEDAPTGSVASVRLSDSDVKDIYYPFMYFLLIIILIGALMNVIN